MGRKVRAQLCFFLGSALLLSWAANAAQAQATDARKTQRRAFVEDLLRGLIDSQTQPQGPSAQQARPFPGQNQQNPRFVPPVQLPPGQTGNNRQRVVVETTQKMRQAQQALGQFSTAADGLISELRLVEWQSSAVRPLLADALKLKADVDHLSRKAQLYPRLDPLVDEYSLLDRDLRVLEQRLKQFGQLRPQTLNNLDQMVRTNEKLAGIFGVQPQVDRRELMRLTALMRSNFQHLLQDLHYESAQRPELNNVLNDGRNVFAQLNQASSLIPTADYQTIVSAYRNGQQDWRSFNQKLYRVSSERIIRDVQEIESLGRQIQEQLWLPVPLDREYIAFLTDAVNDGATRTFDHVTLSQLLKCPDPDQILRNARELRSTGDTLKAGVQSGQSVDNLAWDHRLFDVQWSSMHESLHQLKDPSLEQHLTEIDFTMATLRKTFGDGPAIDQRQLTEMAEQIDQLAYQLDKLIEQRLRSGRYPGDFQQAVISRIDRVHESAHEFHQWLVAGNDSFRSPKRVQQLISQWDDLRNQFANFQPGDRAALANLQSQMEPLMVKLKLVFVN